MAGLSAALVGLEQALDRSPRHQMWRWLVRHRLTAVLDALAGENDRALDAWLAARHSLLERERETLMLKLDRFAAQVTDAPDVEALRRDLKRLVSEVKTHRQRLNDLLYDTVALELGGSE